MIAHFLEALPSWGSRMLADIGLPALKQRLSEAVAEGCAAWPTLKVSEATFVAAIGRAVPARTDPAAALAEMRFGDLYLVHACIQGAPGALEILGREYVPVIARYLRRMDATEDVIADVSQSLLVDLLAPRAGGACRLAQYDGRSTLAQWIGISAQRTLMKTRRSEHTHERLISRLADQPAPIELGAEDSLLRRRYKAILEKALVAAVAALDRRQRNFMRFHLVGGISKAKIAKMYRLDERSVRRLLERAQHRLWSDVRSRLHADLGLSFPEVDSILRGLGPELDISLSGALASSTGGEAPGEAGDPVV
jgi:RNA polymerase sigma-70 factor, ECF subfamily